MAEDLAGADRAAARRGAGRRRRGGGRGAVAGDSLVDRGQERRAGARRALGGLDVGLRVLIGRRQACVSSSDIRDETLTAMAERAVAMAREAPEDPWCGLADPGRARAGWDAGALDLEDPAPLPAPAELEARRAGRRSCRPCGSGRHQMEAAGASWSASRIHLAATNGFSGGYGRSRHAMQAVAICGEGTAMERDYAFESRSHRADLPEPEAVGRLRRRAHRRARRRRASRRPAPSP